MGHRAVVLFWGAVAASVFFLGSVWAAGGQLEWGRHAVANDVVMSVAVTGLGATTFVAGRIAFVVGRSQRRARLKPSEHPVGPSGGEG
jgi:hypothetical protein